MAEQLTERAYYSILRWRGNATRDEARNVAVILADAEGHVGGIRSAPISTISSRLHDQGIVDAVVAGLAERFEQESKLNVGDLQKMHRSLNRSLYLTEPQPVVLTDLDTTIGALYRAYVAPRGGGSSVLTKGKVLDRVVEALRKQGYSVQRGVYVSDFIFDIVLESGARRTVGQVLSFATAAKNWIPAEHAAGHFLYASGELESEATAFIQPPSEISQATARGAYERVVRWYEREGVRTFSADEINGATRLLM